MNKRLYSQLIKIVAIFGILGFLAGCESILRVILNDGHGLRSQIEESPVSLIQVARAEKMPEVLPAQQLLSTPMTGIGPAIGGDDLLSFELSSSLAFERNSLPSDSK